MTALRAMPPPPPRSLIEGRAGPAGRALSGTPRRGAVTVMSGAGSARRRDRGMRALPGSPRDCDRDRDPRGHGLVVIASFGASVYTLERERERER